MNEFRYARLFYRKAKNHNATCDQRSWMYHEMSTRGLTTKCDINHKTSKDEQFRNDFEFVDTTCNKKTKIISCNLELPDLLSDSNKTVEGIKKLRFDIAATMR